MNWRDAVLRLTHFATGVVSAFLIWSAHVFGVRAIVAGVMYEVIFLAYEVTDWLVKRDNPALQILENGLGFGVTMAILFLSELLGYGDWWLQWIR